MSNLSKTVKYQCVQSGGFSATKKLIDFVIPAGGVVDLSNSHININCSIPGDGTSMHIVNLTLLDAQGVTKQVDPVMLVKNCHLSTAKAGLLESVRRQDVLKSTLQQYQEDLEGKQCKPHIGINATRGKNKFNGSAFRELRHTIAGRELDHDIRINLKDIFGAGSIPDFDLDKFGQTRIALECNFDLLGATTEMAATDGAWTEATGGALGAMYTPVANNTGGTLQTTTLLTERTYEIEEFEQQAPFWKGQQLTVTRSINGVAGTIAVIVDSVTWTSADKRVNINLETSAAAVPNGQALTAISVVGVAFAPTPSINSAEIVLSYNASNEASASHEIVTYKTEEDNGANRITHNKQYMIEPEAMGVIVAFPKPSSIYSNLEYSSYRISVNNIAQTDRDVIRRTPLYYDRINRFHQNEGVALKCLNEAALKHAHIPLKTEADTARYASTNNAILETMPLTSGMKNLGLQINSSAGHEINDIIIFKQVLKSF